MNETVADVGEFGLIDRLDTLIRNESVESEQVILGIGDDTACIRPREGFEILITCDALVESRHYLPEHIDPSDLGRRAMVVNISDIGAMGGRPLYAIVSLGLKPDMLVSHVEAMYRGFLVELDPFGACVIGGNITKTEERAFIDITLIGEVEAGKAVRRSTARAGDAILVTGYPGQAACGLHLLLQSKPSPELLQHPLVRCYNTPTHRANEGRAVGLSGYASAMIDTSDGFLGDLNHVCGESGVGAILMRDRLPLSDALRQGAEQLGKDPYELFLHDSDDYELIITCHPDDAEPLIDCIASVSDVPVAEVGHLTEAAGKIEMVHADGTRRLLSAVGWDHFAKEEVSDE